MGTYVDICDAEFQHNLPGGSDSNLSLRDWNGSDDSGKVSYVKFPFTDRVARYLMAVFRRPVISNRQHAADLPSSWRTLAILAQLPESQFLKRGAPGLQKSEAQKRTALALRKQGKTQAEVAAMVGVDQLSD